MQDRKREEFKDRLVQLCAMAVINGTERVVVDLPSLLELFDSEISKAREEGFADGVELEQLLNAEFFGEDYQNPKRLKELKKKYNFEDNK